MKNFDLYLEKNKDISFIAYKTYRTTLDISNTQGARDRKLAPQDLNEAVVVDESIQPVNETLVDAVQGLLEAKDEYASILQSFGMTSELRAPCLFVFHQRNEWDSIRLPLPESSHQQMTMLWEYPPESWCRVCSSGLEDTDWQDYSTTSQVPLQAWAVVSSKQRWRDTRLDVRRLARGHLVQRDSIKHARHYGGRQKA